MTTAAHPPARGEQRFWDLAEPLLGRGDVSRSTMMGLPCLRVGGQFFASTDRTTGALLVKLPAARVDQLIEAGTAEPFAPAGRRFREWASIPYRHTRRWNRLLDEALAFVTALPPAKAKTSR